MKCPQEISCDGVRMNHISYHVHFHTPQGSNDGLVVIKDLAINGGDTGYLYTGTATLEGSNVKATLRIKRWQPGAVSVFGAITEFTLSLAGSVRDEGFSVKGTADQVPGVEISIDGRKISDAV